MKSIFRLLSLCPLLTFAAFPPALVAAQGTAPFDSSQVNEIEITYTQGYLGTEFTQFWHLLLLAYNPLVEADTSVTAELRVNAETETYPIEVEYRGNSTYFTALSICGPDNYSRKPLKLKADDDDWAGVKRMRFNPSNTSDHSFMSEVLTRQILGRFTFAQRDALVRISMGPNHSMPQGEYLSMGMYLYHESIDSQFESRRLLGNEGIRFAITGQESAQVWTGAETTQASFHQLGSGSGSSCAEAEAAYFGDWDGSLPGPDTDTDCDWEELYGIGWVLKNLDPGTPAFAEEMEKHLDVDQMMWSLAAWHMLGDPDNMQVRFVEDSHHGRMLMIPYDVSQSIVPDDFAALLDNPFLAPVDFNQADELKEALMTHPEYRARYQHHMRLTYREAFIPGEFARLGETYRGIVTNHAGGLDGQSCPGVGYQYPPSTIDPNQTISENGITFDDGPNNHGWLRTLSDYTTRYGNLATLPGATMNEPVIYPLPILPSQPIAHTPTTVTALVIGTQFPRTPQVTLRWRTVGAYAYVPMFDDGIGADIVAGDLRFTAEIPPQASGSSVEYYIEVFDDNTNAADPVMAFAPERSGFSPETFHAATSWSTSFSENRVVINEIMADPSTGSEFIEIFNPSDETIDLSGWILDDDALPGIADIGDERFVFPSGATITPGQHLVVWGSGGGPGWQAPFSLKARGETVTLAMPDNLGNPISDVHHYHRGFRGVSVGRVMDGKAVWKDFVQPTPGATNGVVGDYTGDGSLTGMDLTPFILEFGSSGIGLTGDLNGDLIVDELDLEILTAAF